MQAIVEAAIISGCFGLISLSGTVAVAIAGFRANRRISKESLEANRERGLWEKKCAAYEEIIGTLDDRQAYRAKIFRIALDAKRTAADAAAFGPIATKYADAFHDPETRQARGRLLAYASPAARTAYWQMVVDDTALGITLVLWGAMLFAQQN